MLHMFVLGGAGYAIGREYRDRTARQWLDAAGGSITAALAGKLLPLAAASLAVGLPITGWFAGFRRWTAGGSPPLWTAALFTLLVAGCAIHAMFVGLTGALRVALPG